MTNEKDPIYRSSAGRKERLYILIREKANSLRSLRVHAHEVKAKPLHSSVLVFLCAPFWLIACSSKDQTSQNGEVWNDSISCLGIGVVYDGKEERDQPICMLERNEMTASQVDVLKSLRLIDYNSVGECPSCLDNRGYFLDLIFEDGTFKRYFDGQTNRGSDKHYIPKSALFDITRSGTLCKNLVGKTFLSRDSFPAFSNDPTLLQNWRVSFTETSYTWVHLDLGQTSFFICADGKFIGMASAKYTILDERTIVWDGLEYVLAD